MSPRRDGGAVRPRWPAMPAHARADAELRDQSRAVHRSEPDTGQMGAAGDRVDRRRHPPAADAAVTPCQAPVREALLELGCAPLRSLVGEN